MAISLGGVTIYPSDAPKKKSKIGKVQVNANGGRTFIQRVTALGAAIFKSQWELEWNDVGETVRAQVETLANVTTSMTYVDQHGTSYTVQTEEEAYEDRVSYISGDGTLYYNVSLTICEV